MNRKQQAWEQVRKALRWIIISGGALTALNAVYKSLDALQGGSINIEQFGKDILFTLAYMALNTVIYYIHEYQKIEN